MGKSANMANYTETPMDYSFRSIVAHSLPALFLTLGATGVATAAEPGEPAEPAPVCVEESQSSCPDGYELLGDFRLTAYVLAREEEFSGEQILVDPCGLKGVFRRDFLLGSGVRMQGSGRAKDGSIIHYKGHGCFERLDCPLTASGRCATEGRTVAVDRSIVAMGSDIWIEGLGHRVAEDTGGGIRGQHIDVWYGEALTMAQAQLRSVRARQVCVPTVLDWEDAEVQTSALLALSY
jgi:3D (Asp-Asp-Asp) domain-containing protein